MFHASLTAEWIAITEASALVGSPCHRVTISSYPKRMRDIIIRNPRACIFVFGISQQARKYSIALHRVIVEELRQRVKGIFKDARRFEEHFVPHFRLACTNSKPVVQVASGNTCVHAYLSLVCTASRAYIYLTNQRIEFPYLHRPLRFFSRNAE